MNTNIKDIIVAVDKLYRLLDLAVNLYFFQPSELSYSMIYMNNIISGIQSGQFLYGNTLFLCEISPDSEFMVTIEYLVIGENGDFKIMICKSAMKIQQQWDKMDLRINLCKDISQSLYL